MTCVFNQAIACDCIGEVTVKDAVKSSDIVITGQVLTKEIITVKDTLDMGPYTTTNSPQYDMTEARYTILIVHRHKGKFKSDTLTIITGTSGGDCGFLFEIGKKYIIYGSNERDNGFHKPKKLPNNDYWTNSCTRTVLYNEKEFQEIKNNTG